MNSVTVALRGGGFKGFYYDKNSKEYYCTFNGEFDDGWITILDDSHPKVLQYIEATDADINVYEADKGEWMQPVWTTL